MNVFTEVKIYPAIIRLYINTVLGVESWANKIFAIGYYHVNPKLCLKIVKSALRIIIRRNLNLQ